MINLLPAEEKKQIRAARSNVLLLRYNIIFLVMIIFLGMSVAVTYYVLKSTQTTAETTITNNTNKERSYATLKAEAEVFRAQLSEAKQVLDGQISYSTTVLTIAQLVPSGVVLTNIKLDQTSFSQPITLVSKIKGEKEALKFRSNFQNSPLFSGVAFGVLTKNEDSNYPYNIELKVTINKEAAK